MAREDAHIKISHRLGASLADTRGHLYFTHEAKSPSMEHHHMPVPAEHEAE